MIIHNKEKHVECCKPFLNYILREAIIFKTKYEKIQSVLCIWNQLKGQRKKRAWLNRTQKTNKWFISIKSTTHPHYFEVQELWLLIFVKRAIWNILFCCFCFAINWLLWSQKKRTYKNIKLLKFIIKLSGKYRDTEIENSFKDSIPPKKMT